jgi:hypothetical protein
VLSGRRLEDLPDVVTSEDVRGVVGKDGFDELPALIGSLFH